MCRGAKPCVIAVCSHELKFIRRYRLGTQTYESVIPNGINVSRIHPVCIQNNRPFTFLAFAGRNVQKRVDLLLMAADALVKNGKQLNVVIVDGNIPTVADTVFGDKPDWLTEITPQEDINSVYAMADCFVSTSVHETFSYAIAEAAIFGLPIIQSDIEGTLWNANNPSTFLFKSENIEDLSRIMQRVMAISPKKLQEDCETSAKNIIRDYSLESWSEKVIEFFQLIP